MKKLLRLSFIGVISFLILFIGLIFYHFLAQGESRISKANRALHIVFGVDNDYHEAMNTAITSLLENHTNQLIHIYVLYTSPLRFQDSTKNLVSFFPNATVSFHRVSVPHEFTELANEKWPISTLLRLFITDILPPSTDRVLYLDADVIIKDSLVDFYNLPMQDAFMIGIRDPQEEKLIKNITAYKLLPHNINKEISQYVNSGVLLFNTEQMRRQGTSRQILSFLKANQSVDQFLYPDQDIINILWQDKIIPAEQKYNHSTLSPITKDTVVIHYMSRPKPWNTQQDKLTFTQFIQTMPWHIYHKKYKNYIDGYNPIIQSYYRSLLDLYYFFVSPIVTGTKFYESHINQSIVNLFSGWIY